jgi:hypothetical protein
MGEVGVLVPRAISPHLTMAIVDMGRKPAMRRRRHDSRRANWRHFAQGRCSVMETRGGVYRPNDMAGITMELDWDVDEAERRGLHATAPARDAFVRTWPAPTLMSAVPLG